MKKSSHLIAVSLLSLVSALVQADVATPSENTTASQSANHLRVFKSPTCGCCEDWISHIQQNGISTDAYNSNQMAEIKDQLGIGPSLRSCHTALSDNGYFFEGHVPARYVQAFLANPPAGAAGLSVPAMPVGSPGMEMGDRFMPYQVVQLNTDGSVQLYASVNSQADQ